jgi:phage shock protein E
MKTLSMSELNETLKTLSQDDLILDVRTVREFSEGHVPGAANIPVDQVMGHANELKKFKNIYIYCKAGMRAEMACEILSSMGLQNLSCVADGGFPDWAQAGFEIEA